MTDSAEAMESAIVDGVRDRGAAAFHMATAHPELIPILPDEVSISLTFWLLTHADSKDLARIRAVADYISEIVERERALFAGR